MNKELISELKKITKEEKDILENGRIDFSYYSDNSNDVVDAKILLKKGKLIDIRKHTRFARFPLHKHNYIETIYQCQGTSTHILNKNRIVHLCEGDLLFLNQSCSQEILPTCEDDIIVNFIILPEFFSHYISTNKDKDIVYDFLITSLSPNSSMGNYLLFKTKNLLPVQNIIENMLWTSIHNNGSINEIYKHSMELLLMNLSIFSKGINNLEQTHNMIFEILKYVNENYTNGTLEQLSKILGLETYQVSRIITKNLGMNFKQLLQKKKFQQASYMLIETNYTIDCIMSKIGYENSSHFYNTFKKFFGMSPKEYRDKYAQSYLQNDYL